MFLRRTIGEIMATRQEFVQGVEEVYKNHGVYVGCGNGEINIQKDKGLK